MATAVLLLLSSIIPVPSAFAAHYKHYSKGLPGAMLEGSEPRQNELICNLVIALDNVRNKTYMPFRSVLGADNGEEELMAYTF